MSFETCCLYILSESMMAYLTYSLMHHAASMSLFVSLEKADIFKIIQYQIDFETVFVITTVPADGLAKFTGGDYGVRELVVYMYMQDSPTAGSVEVCAQPMRDVVTL